MSEFLQSDGQDSTEDGSWFRIVGWVSVGLGMAALGIYAGRELRLRRKFNKRTPYDIFSHAGDAFPGTGYGVGV